jgi:phosphoglycolate phosphatase-like HAD superfamily hydrolase
MQVTVTYKRRQKPALGHDNATEARRLAQAGASSREIAAVLGVSARAVAHVLATQRAIARAASVDEQRLRPRRVCKDLLPKRPPLRPGQCSAARAFELLLLDIAQTTLTPRPA